MAEPTSFSGDHPDLHLSNGLVAKDSPGDNSAPLSVSEISGMLKRAVEDRFGFVRIRGELSGVKRATSGHVYCALKDANARLDGVMWKGVVSRLSFRPEDGLEVIVSGKLTTYAGRSSYQLVIETMEVAGEGALLALLAKLKARLEAEGLFARERKRPLPFLPRVIGVVTSPTGAVIRDILHRLADRFPTHVIVWPVLVQGQNAAQQIADAIHGFGALVPGGLVLRPDLLIVARGGGSIEDLWAFNEEVVVRAIAQSSIPVISAIGHETDTTLADFAADLRAPTPSAAAELAVPVREELRNILGDLALRQRRATVRSIALGRERVEARLARIPSPSQMLATRVQNLDDMGDRLRRALGLRAQVAKGALQQSAARLSLPLIAARMTRSRERLEAQRLVPALLERRLANAGERLSGLSRIMASLDPDRVLQRGYVRVTGRDGRTLVNVMQARQDCRLSLHFRDGTLVVVPEERDFSHIPAAPIKAKRPTPPPQHDLFGQDPQS